MIGYILPVTEQQKLQSVCSVQYEHLDPTFGERQNAIRACVEQGANVYWKDLGIDPRDYRAWKRGEIMAGFPMIKAIILGSIGVLTMLGIAYWIRKKRYG